MEQGKDRVRPYLRDPDDPEYIKDLQRPAVIKEDLSEMERRKRVQEILESKSFCQELEEVIRQECDTARHDPDHLEILHRLSDLTISHGNMSFVNLHSHAGNPIIIADLRINEKYSKLERIQRNKLACLFRIADFFQWAQGIHNEITYRMNDEENSFLTNPFGLLYHEITAATLVKVSSDGDLRDAGSLNAGFNKASFRLHSEILKNRPSSRCILHMRSAVVAAVASMKCGLLPLCHEAMVIGPVGYLDYQDIDGDNLPYEKMLNILGDKNIVFLRNQGFLVVGDTIEHAAFLVSNTISACETQVIIISSQGCLVIGDTIEEGAIVMRNLVTACDHQVRAARVGLENLIIPNEKTIDKTFRNSKIITGSAVEWKIGELEWESWMRVLDNANFRTGHIYRQPQLRSKSPMSTSVINNSEIAIPPSSSAYGQIDESDSESLAAHRLALLRKEQEKAKWLNSPNAYQKIEFYEYGSDTPKKITKWVQDNNTPSASGTPVKINSVHQFSPASSNSKEFKEKQKRIKENSRLGTTTAGPQSQILGGVTFEDISLVINHDIDGTIGQSAASDRAILIGTASKGIIDRQYQHHAQVYHQIYAPNPFSIETDEGIQRYIEEVKAKNHERGDLCTPKSDINQSAYDEYESDSLSLMQGVREHSITKELATISALDDQLNATTVSAKDNENVSHENTDHSMISNSGVTDCFPSTSASLSPKLCQSNKSPTGYSLSEGISSNRSCNMGSESEVAQKGEKRKKKRGLLSFMRKKDKASFTS